MSSERGRQFAGCTVALVTPFQNGQVDYEALGQLVDWQIEQGTPTISPVGTTGESPTLSHDEHERVIAAVVERANGRAQVMAGTGSNATSEAVRLTRFAQKAGATAALVVSPYYNRPTQEGLYRHYATLAEQCDIPIVVYNVPARTGRNIEPSTVARLTRFSNIVAVKEAAGSLDQVSELVDKTDLAILSGDDSLTLPKLAVGAVGVVSVVGNLVPRDVMAMVNAFQQGDIHRARELHRRLFPLCRDMLGLAPNPIPVKTALELLGRCSAELRLPLDPLDDTLRAALEKTLSAYGLLPNPKS